MMLIVLLPCAIAKQRRGPPWHIWPVKCVLSNCILCQYRMLMSTFRVWVQNLSNILFLNHCVYFLRVYCHFILFQVTYLILFHKGKPILLLFSFVCKALFLPLLHANCESLCFSFYCVWSPLLFSVLLVSSVLLFCWFPFPLFSIHLSFCFV